jgi:hypothetical protein
MMSAKLQKLPKAVLQQAYFHSEDKIDEINDFFNKLNPKLLSNPYHLSNPILGRNIHEGMFIQNILLGRLNTRANRRYLIPIRLIACWVKNLILFASYLITFVMGKLIFPSSKLQLSRGKVSIIDVFVLVNDVLERKSFIEDRYFSQLYKTLENNNENYVIAPAFYPLEFNCLKMARAFRIMRNSPDTLLTEFDVLKLSDLFATLKYILAAPLHYLAIRKAASYHKWGEVFEEQVLASFTKVRFYHYLRYRVGLRIGVLLRDGSRVISWYENQSIDKNFISGLRTSDGEFKIFGCQFAHPSPLLVHYHPIESEHKLGLLPDVILVNGPYYFQYANKACYSLYSLGVSLRYRSLLDLPLNLPRQTEIVIFLSYITHSKSLVLGPWANGVLKDFNLLIKFHPANPPTSEDRLPANWKITTTAVNDLYKICSVAIVSESGIFIEAVACGISVILIGNIDQITYNQLPEYSRGKSWEIVFYQEDFEGAYKKLVSFKKNNRKELQQLAERVRKDFFDTVIYSV